MESPDERSGPTPASPTPASPTPASPTPASTPQGNASPGSASPGSVAAVLPAAGSGRRFGAARNKLFATLAGKPVWVHAADRLRECREIGRLVIAVSASDRDAFTGEYHEQVTRLGVEIVEGGGDRVDSVRAGLARLEGDPAVRMVAIHDAARPLLDADDLAGVIAAARHRGAAILATPVVGTVKRDSGQCDWGERDSGERDSGQRANCVTVDRSNLWVALTPQVARVDWLADAYRRHRGRPVTDDAQLLELAGYPVALVAGRADNLKITLPEDLAVAEALLARSDLTKRTQS